MPEASEPLANLNMRLLSTLLVALVLTSSVFAAEKERVAAEDAKERFQQVASASIFYEIDV